MQRAAGIAAAVALAAATTVNAAPVCFDATGLLCLDWIIADGNLTLTAYCTGFNGAVVGWCAFGISASGVMYPAEVWRVSSSIGSSVVRYRCDAMAADRSLRPPRWRSRFPPPALQFLDNRHNIAHARPACFPTQVASLLAASVSPDSSHINATFTRPLLLDAGTTALGYNNITDADVRVIAALNFGALTDSTPCGMDFQVHGLAVPNTTINWHQPPETAVERSGGRLTLMKPR